MSGLADALPPDPTPLIGREDALEHLGARLNDGERLITLWGSPGIGKTRLAIALARGAGMSAMLVECVEESDEAGLCAALARTLSISLSDDPVGDIGKALKAAGTTVVVLDGFDRSARTAPDTLSRWLRAAPDARFIATSRERLRLAEEISYEVGPLGLPKPGTDPTQSHAMQLFVERVGRQIPDFSVDADSASMMVELVCALEGNPLVTELAAARMDVLGLDGLLVRLQASRTSRLDLLSSGSRGGVLHHGSLRDAIALSWDLLGSEEQRALAGCSVFRGGFTLDAAAAILEADALQIVTALRDRSLIRVAQPGRFTMCQGVRAFAAEALDSSDEVADARQRHAEWYASWAPDKAVAFDLRGEPATDLLTERDNLIAALEWSLSTHELDRAQRLILALEPVRVTQGPAAFYLELIERVCAEGDPSPDLLRIRGRAQRATGDWEGALATLEGVAERVTDPMLSGQIARQLGVLKHQRREVDTAREHYTRALELHEQVGHQRGVGMAVGNLGALAHDVGDFEAAHDHYETALTHLRAVGDRRLEGLFLVNAGILDKERRRDQAARSRFQDAIGLLEPTGDLRFRAMAHANLGTLEHASGEWDASRTNQAAALTLLDQVGDLRSVALCRARLGAVLADLGEIEPARHQLGEAERGIAMHGTALDGEVVRLHLGFLDITSGATADAAERLATAQSPSDTRDEPLVSLSDDARHAVRLLIQRLTESETSMLLVGPEAAWFRAPDGERHELEKYASMRRILDFLVHARARDPDARFALSDLFEAGWPGEQAGHESAANRVYVALANLRKRGLGSVVLKDDAGYRLDPHIPVVHAD